MQAAQNGARGDLFAPRWLEPLRQLARDSLPNALKGSRMVEVHPVFSHHPGQVSLTQDQEVVQAVRLEILRFPVAAPELNPQEHVWKATRWSVSHNHTIRRLPELAEQIRTHLTAQTFKTSFLDRYGFDVLRPIFR